MIPQSSRTVRVRPFAPADRAAVPELARRVTIGIGSWRDPRGVLAAARRWIDEAIDGMARTGR